MRSVVLLALSAACGREPRRPPPPAGDGPPPAVPETHWLIAPTPDGDFLSATASEAGLIARLGAAQVRADSIEVGEGQSESGTVIFPGDSTRELLVLWQDSSARSRPSVVYVRSAHSAWRVFPGVGVGTDLRTLDSLNGRAFLLFGFDWDYGGTTSSFEGGRLDSLWRGGDGGRLVLLRLDPGPAAGADSLRDELVGEREFSSRLPAMRALNPRVYEMLVYPR